MNILCENSVDCTCLWLSQCIYKTVLTNQGFSSVIGSIEAIHLACQTQEKEMQNVSSGEIWGEREHRWKKLVLVVWFHNGSSVSALVLQFLNLTYTPFLNSTKIILSFRDDMIPNIHFF